MKVSTRNRLIRIACLSVGQLASTAIIHITGVHWWPFFLLCVYGAAAMGYARTP